MTINHARKLLGVQAKSMSDEQVESLVNQLLSFAEIIVAQITTNGSNKQLGVIDSNYKEGQNGIN